MAVDNLQTNKYLWFSGSLSMMIIQLEVLKQL